MPTPKPSLNQVVFRIDENNRVTRAIKAPPIENAVFEGAGVLGAAYWEVYQAMEKRNIHLKRVGGSSAGACFATLLAFGHTGKEVESFGRNFNFKALCDLDAKALKRHLESKNIKLTQQDHHELKKIIASGKQSSPGALSKFSNAVKNLVFSSRHGLYKGKVLLAELRDLIRKQTRRKLENHLKSLRDKPEEKRQFIKFLQSNFIANVRGDSILLPREITFKHHRLLQENYPQLGFKELHVTGTNKTKKHLEIFNADTEPDMEIALAVRISMSMPGVFKSVKYKNNYYTDGGCMCNFPMQIFDAKSLKSKRFQPKGFNQYMGEEGQNLATIGFKPDTPAEVAGYNGPLPKRKKGKWNSFKYYWRRGVLGTLKYKATKWGAYLFAGRIQVMSSLKKEYVEVREKYLPRVVQIPAYDTNEKNQKSLKRFSSSNFNLPMKDLMTMARNGGELTETYLDAHHNELLEMKAYDNISQMPREQLKELQKKLQKGKSSYEIFESPGATEAELENKRQELLTRINFKLTSNIILTPRVQERKEYPVEAKRQQKHPIRNTVIKAKRELPEVKGHAPVVVSARKIQTQRRYPPGLLDSMPRPAREQKRPSARSEVKWEPVLAGSPRRRVQSHH